MMSPKQIYDISIMFHTNAMICHGHLAKMEWVEFKATHFDGCKGPISCCQYNQWWTDIFFMYSYGWVGGYFDFGCATPFPRFHSLDFHGLLLLAFKNILFLIFFAFVFLFMN
jgi:hypothetical protein